MAQIVAARAFANDEVAFIAWSVDEVIPQCLGFELTRRIVAADVDSSDKGSRARHFSR